MDRRIFIKAGAAFGGAGLAGALATDWGRALAQTNQTASQSGRNFVFDTKLQYPGMAAGHQLRQVLQAGGPSLSAAPVARKVDALIVGSGAAALSCAWRLSRNGFKNFLMVQGPVPSGNMAHGAHPFSAYPLAAHYLPLPAPGLSHVRELLSDLGVLQEGLKDEAPLYDERYVVHANAERVLHKGKWSAGLVPPLEPGSAASAQWAHISQKLQDLKASKGADGQHLFNLPSHQSTAIKEPALQALDRLSFATWLASEAVTDALLLWYFDYCCKDEYGAGAAQVSAWAGLQYFCARHGVARNAQEGAVLTSSQGLGFLAQGMRSRIAPDSILPGTVAQVNPLPSGGYRVVVLAGAGAALRVEAVECRHLVMAAPLFVAKKLVPWHFEGLAQEPGAQMSPWLVTNFFMKRFPKELEGEGLSWDNVVAGSNSLGYVVATHQGISTALPAGTVWTGYHAPGGADPAGQRAWLRNAPAQKLLEVACADLDAAYGRDWERWCAGVELTVHGHAMSVPSPGFLSEPVAARARAASGLPKKKGSLQFAHSDLSGFSVFEEASFWGVKAADALL